MKCTKGRQAIGALLACGLLSSCANQTKSQGSLVIPAHAVVGVQQEQLRPEFWIARESNAKKLVLDSQSIALQNARLMKLDPSVHDLEKMPGELAAAEVRTWIEKISQYPDEDMFDDSGRKLERPDFDALMNNVALESVPASQHSRYGLVVKRADLRTFPSPMRGYESADDRDVDRFQETALFPGTPVLIAHESRDGNWWFIVSPQYAAWVEKRFIAEGAANEVFAYTRKTDRKSVV